MSSQQVRSDGEIEFGEDPSHPSVEQRMELLSEALNRRSWKATIQQQTYSGSNFVKFIVELSTSSVQLKLHVFVFPNLAWANRNAKNEKRIQLTQDFAQHAVEFSLPKEGAERCLLLGIYRRENLTVFCAWDANRYLDHKSPSSCYVDISGIAKAARDGFGQSIDKKGRLVCCFQPDFAHYYVMNMGELHERVTVSKVLSASEPPPPEKSFQQLYASPNSVPSSLARNRIVYGAPGTGKSYKVSEESEKYFPDPLLRERVTFFPDYSYGQFVGSYKPSPVYRAASSDMFEADQVTPLAPKLEPVVDYRFVAGPFLKMYVRAKRHPEHNFLLIVEELNRADSAAVFGDVFQLLDRSANGNSRYSIGASAELCAYLASQGVDHSELRLPSNLYLWATMNSADQGVQLLDAAFKRRWEFEFIPLESGREVVDGWKINLKFEQSEVPWNRFRDRINSRLKQLGMPEDRLLGPFFLSESELDSGEAFKHKLLLYLRDDVVRHHPEELFLKVAFSEIVTDYDKGLPVFREISFGA